jgi:hypothetical protein
MIEITGLPSVNQNPRADPEPVLRMPKAKAKRAPLVLSERYYDHQLGEGAKRFQAFRIWLGLREKRSYEAVARALRKSSTLIRRWAKEDKWEVRLQAYDRDQDKERRTIEREILKKDTEDMLKLVRARARMLSLEAARRLRMIDAGHAESMTNAELDRGLEAVVKLYRLLNDQSTENVVTDTPELQRERSFQCAVQDTREDILAWQAENPGASLEEIQQMQNKYLDWGVEFYPGVDRSQLAAVIMGSVDESSSATN